MKRLLLTVICLWCAAALCRAQMQSQADERLELTTVVFRLAGMREWVNNEVSGYASDIDAYFDTYKDHKLIGYIKELRQQYGLAYASVAGSAPQLDIEGKRVRLSPHTTLSEAIAGDPRWTEETFSEYIELLDDFYRRSRFHRFYEAHRELYALAKERLDENLKDIDPQWFRQFYDVEFSAPAVYVGVGNGRNNYIVDDPGAESGYAIMIGCLGDGERLPRFSDLVVNTVVHEIGHFYVEPLFREYWPQMEAAANIIYPQVQREMWEIAYGSPSEVMVEWMTNLFKLVYLKEERYPDFPISLRLDNERGFIWMPRSVRFMENFTANRDRFQSIADFMPLLVGFVNSVAADFDRVMLEYEQRNPYVVSVFPANGSNISDYMELEEVRVTFSEPMRTDVYHYAYLDEGDTRELLPAAGYRWEDEYTFVIPLKPDSIEPGKEYAMKLEQYSYVNVSEYPIKEDYIITYNTFTP